MLQVDRGSKSLRRSNSALAIITALFAAFFVRINPVPAQCSGEGWIPIVGLTYLQAPPFVDTVTTWDPDGPGPSGPQLVAAGELASAGGTATNNIAAYSFETGQWNVFGSGLGGINPSFPDLVAGLAVLPNNQLVAGGFFNRAGTVPVDSIARWDGQAWNPVGTTTQSLYGIRDLLVLPSGDLIAGGRFINQQFRFVARWNGSQWSSMGVAFNGSVLALAQLPNGDIVAGGNINMDSGFVTSRSIARWDGTQWTGFGRGLQSGMLDTYVSAIVILPNGHIVAGGSFRSVMQPIPPAFPDNVAIWNGTAWGSMGAGPGSQLPTTHLGESVDALVALPNGHIIAGGRFPGNLSRWNGTSWSRLGGGTDREVFSLVLGPGGELIVSGNFAAVGGRTSTGVARYTFTGIPWTARQPQDSSLAPTQTLTLSATPATGYANVSAQWFRNGVPITDGPAGASADGGLVSGASLTLPTPTDGTPATLTISNAQPSDVGSYTVRFMNACGESESSPAVVTVSPPCLADFNTTGGLTSQDILDFISAFFSANIQADFNADSTLSVQDIFDFLTAWFAGC